MSAWGPDSAMSAICLYFRFTLGSGRHSLRLFLPKSANSGKIRPRSIEECRAEAVESGGVIRKALRPDGVIVAAFNGEAAGQTVYHLHFHVIPCWARQPFKGHGHGQKADAGQLHRLAQAISAGLEG